MDKQTIEVMPNTDSVTKGRDDDDDITGTLALLRELTDSVKKDIEMDSLQAAFSMLYEAVKKEVYIKKGLAPLKRLLAQALLTRYALHGWIEDLDASLTYDEEPMIQASDEDIDEVQIATQLIQVCRNSLNVETLENIICIAEESLSSCIDDTLQNAELLAVLGKALVIKFLYSGETNELVEAAAKFQDAERISASHASMQYVSLVSLTHIEWLRFVDLGEADAAVRAKEYLKRARAVDQEASDLFDVGVKMLGQRAALDDAQLQECIALLTGCSNRRLVPHPRRLVTLDRLGLALFSRFEKRGIVQDLEECITVWQESLDLRPSPHLLRSWSLDNLASTLLIRFKHKGALKDLESNISLLREALDLLPQVASPSFRVMSLNKLAKSLSDRFNRMGAIQDLEESIVLQREALELQSAPAPNYVVSLDFLAYSLLNRFEQNRSFGDLEECIRLWREVLILLPARQSLVDRSLSLSNMANALFARFKTQGEVHDIEESIAFHREALDLRPISHPRRFVSLTGLANALDILFEQKGTLQDLEDSISLYREALKLLTASHPSHSSTRRSLASGLSTRFEVKGSFDDLEECISLLQEALNSECTPNSLRHKTLNTLSNALSMRFEQKGAFEDLEDGIIYQREALDLVTPSHPDRSWVLNDLASILLLRFQQQGTSQDLEEAIQLQREALDLRPVPHPNRHTSLCNLASALSLRFNQRREFQDLEEGILLQREALDLQPESHITRFASITNLSNSLFIRFERKGTFEDLEECVDLRREALKSLPASHRGRFLSVNNLAFSLLIRFEKNKDLQDLQESFMLQQEVLNHLPAPQPSRSALLLNIAKAFCTYHEQKTLQQSNPSWLSTFEPMINTLYPGFDYRQDDAAVEIALRCYEEASKYETGSLVDRIISAKLWSVCAHKYRRSSMLNAFQYGMGLLPLLASLDLSLQQRQDALQASQEFVGPAARCAITSNQLEIAVVFLSTGRSVFWSQALQLRTPVDELMTTHRPLAEEFTKLSRQLERASYSSNRSGNSRSGVLQTDKQISPRALADQRQHAIEEIRKVPGFERFMEPPTFRSLQPAASNGPIILLNASLQGCDVLVMHKTDRVQHVPLSGIRLKELEELQKLTNMLIRAGTRSVEISRDASDVLGTWLGRDMARNSPSSSSEDTFQLILRGLWVKVVQPVVKALELEKTDSPTRVWWCPTGPFSSLPIHAAGIYSDDNEPIDCLFQYAVSSYCTSPQDLLHPQPQITPGFKMAAIIEPEAPGAAVLPATRKELKEIEKHVPDCEQHLLVHIGSKHAPNRIDDLLADIQHSSFTHFGCHGMQNLTNPLESHLLLSGGQLTLSRIIQECQVPEGALAYLSACETAKGDEDRPDEALNLVASMMFAGFRSVVGTLWSILDEDAPVVADVFYGHLFRNGKDALPDVRDAAYGLHLATKELRDQGKPFYSWVPYVHYGI